MADVWIDLSQATNGTGTFVNPYNSFTEVNALSGGLSGDTIAVKANGAISRTLLNLGDCVNYTLTDYGSGARAIVKGTAEYSGTWIQSGDEWYSETGTGHGDAIFINGIKLEQTAEGSPKSLSANQSWYDTVNDRTYIKYDGTNPNSDYVEITDKNTAIALGSNVLLTDVNASGLRVIGSRGSAFRILRLSSGCRIHDFKVESGGTNEGADGRNNCLIRGFSDVAMADSSCSIYNMESIWARNNALELWYMDGVHIHDNEVSCQVGMGFELWQYMQNCELYRNIHNTDHLNSGSTYYGAGTNRMFWCAGTSESLGLNTGNKFYNNVGGYTRGAGVAVWDSCDNNEIYHNTFYGWQTAAGIVVDNKDSDVATGTVIKQNILYADANNTFIDDLDANSTIDRNLAYASQGGAVEWKHNTSTVTTLAAWNALAGVTNEAEGDPLFTDVANHDVTIPLASPAPQNTGLVTTDFVKYARHNGYAGAYEPRVVPLMTNRISNKIE